MIAIVIDSDKKKYEIMKGLTPFESEDIKLVQNNCEQKKTKVEQKWKRRRIKWDQVIKEDGWFMYTDGSKIGNKVGIAVLIFHKEELVYQVRTRISNHASIFDAKALAILKGIEMHIHTDSRSVLRALEGYRNENLIIENIRKELENGYTNFEFHWFKAHVGVPKNEKVDAIAKLATQDKVISENVKFTKKEIGKILRAEAMRRWEYRWNHSQKGRRTYYFYPEVDESRIEADFYCNQILTGHGALGPHQRRFCDGELDCDCGNDVASDEHLIKDSVIYDDQRLASQLGLVAGS